MFVSSTLCRSMFNNVNDDDDIRWNTPEPTFLKHIVYTYAKSVERRDAKFDPTTYQGQTMRMV